MSKTPPKRTTGTPSRTATRASGKSFGSEYIGKNIFTATNYKIMGIGVLFIAVGLFLMRGGQMPDPNTWDPNLIYSPIRITLSPILILIGLALQIVAIFKK
jgi:hypothetical protein